MPFRFSLQEVLDYRKRIEEMRQRELGETQRSVDRVENLIGQARALRARCRSELSARLEKGGQWFPYHEIYVNYLKALEGLIAKSETHLTDLRAELERRRLLLEYASRQRQVLDELRKQELKQFVVGERRAERKQFDEMAIRNYLVSSREKDAGPPEGSGQ